MAVLVMPSRVTPGARSPEGDSTAYHQMWQVLKVLDATGGVGPQNPVLDIEVRGACFSERERRGVGGTLLLPMRALFMTLQSVHGQLFRAFFAARPVQFLPPLVLSETIE